MKVREYVIDHLVKVVDGDTVDLSVDLGFQTHVIQRFRLWGVNAPEKHGETMEEALAAQTFVQDWFAVNDLKELRVRSHKLSGQQRDKYGRYVADIFFYSDQTLVEIRLSDELIESGNAVPFMDEGFYTKNS